jgi:peptide/nickel transport system ATP-binding protein
VLEAVGAGKVYGGGLLGRGETLRALHDFSLAFRGDEPRIVALAGQSGSGKTTAAQLLLGFVSPSEGEIRYAGAPVSGLRGAARRRFRRDVQAILQDPYAAYNPVYRVRHVFDVVARNFAVGDSDAERRRRVAEAVEFVGLDPGRVLDRYPHQLSGGERQRIMIARALLLRPRVIVADEPVSMVDASIRSAILEIIVRLKEDEGISFLYVTHDLSTAYHLADELIVLFEGETVERGPARQVIDAPRHEYTRLLIDSIPVPDPAVRWEPRPALTSPLPT